MHSRMNNEDSIAIVIPSSARPKEPRCQSASEERFRNNAIQPASYDVKAPPEDEHNCPIRRVRKRPASLEEGRKVSTGWTNSSDKKTRRNVETTTSRLSSFLDFHSAKLFWLTTDHNKGKSKVAGEQKSSSYFSVSGSESSVSDRAKHEDRTELGNEGYRNAPSDYFDGCESQGDPVDLRIQPKWRDTRNADTKTTHETLSTQDNLNNQGTISSRSTKMTENRQRSFGETTSELPTFSDVSVTSHVSALNAVPYHAKERPQTAVSGDTVINSGTSSVKSNAAAEKLSNQSPYQKIVEMSRKPFGTNGPFTVPLTKTDTIAGTQRPRKLKGSSPLPVQTNDLNNALMPTYRQFRTAVRHIPDGSFDHLAARAGQWGRRPLYSDVLDYSLLHRFWSPRDSEEFRMLCSPSFHAPSIQAAAAGNMHLRHLYAHAPAHGNARYALLNGYGLDAQRNALFPDIMTMNHGSKLGKVNRHSSFPIDFLSEHSSEQNHTALGFTGFTPHITDGLGTQTEGSHCNNSTFRNSMEFLLKDVSKVAADQQSTSVPYARYNWAAIHKSFGRPASSGELCNLLPHSLEAPVISAAPNTPANGGCVCLSQPHRSHSYRAQNDAIQKALTYDDDTLRCYERKLLLAKLCSENHAYFKQLPY